jgi:hypothetical protein
MLHLPENNIQNLSLNDSNHFLISDGVTGLSILPLAALFTGTLLTISIAILLIVVLAVRRKRETQNMYDGKDKHIGKFHQLYYVIYLFSIVNP